MLIIEKISILRSNIRLLRQNGKRIALVPTMGNLHNGHMALVDEARKHADIVVVTIFVNPMQFDRVDDMILYPRTVQKDYEMLQCRGVDLVFSPSITDIYPNGLETQTFVEVPELSYILEGASRPGHFRGVSTIISKLFNLIQPDIACFGEKDYQQLALIKKMVIDMCYDINIIGIPTVRTKDGVALSSRNGYLTDNERKLAPVVSQIIHDIALKLTNGDRNFEEIIETSKEVFIKRGMLLDNLAIRDAETLMSINNMSKRAVILIAVWLGKARLIDNKTVDLI